MMLRMKERVTISVEPEALEIARAEVSAGQAPNLSAALEGALRARGRSEALREAVELAEQEHGPVSEEMKEWAIKELKRALRETSSSTQGR
jgi:Arc/MetJ-type ribon-helix-helix transcriptional regulator